MRVIQFVGLGFLLTCLSSCKTIKLDIYAGSDQGYIINIEQKKIYTAEPEFNKYGCMHVDEYARLAKYIKRNCK
jgi:hypothetical protein